MKISYPIPELGGYEITEDKKVISPYGQKYVKYQGDSVIIWVFGGWRVYDLNLLYKKTFDGIRL